MGRFNIYLTDHSLSVRKGGVEKTILKRKRNKFKESIIEERGGECEICGTALEWADAQIHHVMPVCSCPELRFEKSNVVLLCRKCHYNIHKTEELERRLVTTAAAESI